MKFGKEFRTHLEETIPEWRDKFLCYKPLKKFIKQVPSTPGAPLSSHADHLQEPVHAEPTDVDGRQDRPEPAGQSLLELQDWFIGILNEELKKLNEFYMEKEEDFVIDFQVLKQRIEGLHASDSEFSEEMMEIRKELVTIHGKMVLLKTYSSLNFAGLIKILKKYDKRTGALLQLPFVQLVFRQPFFTTEPLTRLVRECEANLELLFPLQEEVIQSTPSTDQSTSPAENTPGMLRGESSNLGEETMHIYRSTRAAMEAIKCLQKESSTCNPFSFSSLCRNQDADGTGLVTAENSPDIAQNDDKEETKSVFANSMRFEISSGHTKCISEDIKSNAMTVGKYNIIAPNEGFPVPDTHKLIVRVTSPHGTTYHHGEHVESGDFAFTASEGGDYTTCFWAGAHNPPVTVTVDFDWRTGVSAKDWSKVAKKGQIEVMELELKKLFDTVHSIHDEMFYLREREEEMQELNRATNSNMATFGILSILVCLSVAGLQLWHLKAFFERKKLL